MVVCSYENCLSMTNWKRYSVNIYIKRQHSATAAAAAAMKIITQLVILTLSLLLVNADQYCDDAVKQYQTFGNRCSLKNLTFSNCCDLRIVSQVSRVHKQSRKAFGTNDVYCDMTTKYGGWTVIQRNKKDSLVNFNRNWTDYEKGFGDLNTEFGMDWKKCTV